MAAANTDKLKKLARRWVGTIGTGGVADADVTTIPLASATNLPTDTAVVAVIDRVDTIGTATPTSEESVIGVVSGTNLVTCTRGAEGTAQAHSAGAVVEILVTAKGWNDIIDGILVAHSQLGHHTITIADAANTTGITVTQNDVTNNPNAVTITNAGTGHGLYINQTGVLATDYNVLFVYSNAEQVNALSYLVEFYQANASSTVGIQRIVNFGTGHALYVYQSGVLAANQKAVYIYSNAAQTTGANSELLLVYQDNASSTNDVVQITNDGTGTAFFIDQNGNAVALDIDAETANDQTIVSVTPAGTGPSSFLIARNDDVTGNIVLRLGANYIWVDTTGDLRISSTNPTSDTSGVVVGSQS